MFVRRVRPLPLHPRLPLLPVVFEPGVLLLGDDRLVVGQAALAYMATVAALAAPAALAKGTAGEGLPDHDAPLALLLLYPFCDRHLPSLLVVPPG